MLLPGEMGHRKWPRIFSRQWMEVPTFVVIVSLLVHVWVGMRDIQMDYVKPAGARLALQVGTIVWLVGCAGRATQVLWMHTGDTGSMPSMPPSTTPHAHDRSANRAGHAL